MPAPTATISATALPEAKATIAEASAAPVPTPTIAPETLQAAILKLDGMIYPVHDPAIIKADNKYYLFSTGAGIPLRCSSDMLEWEYCGQVMTPPPPKWIQDAVPGVLDLWAPDISFWGGKYHLYFSGSTFGSNRSVIALATNETLDPDDPRYKWQDEGEVIASHTESTFNAIDPNLVIDRQGQPWLAFGSYWTGIKLVQLDPATGKPAPDAQLYDIASKPGNTAIEGAFIVPKDDYYYLFVSHDFCCRGVASTYNMKVGRAKEITGPYLDRDGKPLLGGGGTPLYAGSKRWRGPGHNAILVQDGDYYLVYHAYDGQVVGRPTLRIEKLFWDGEGWPLAPSALLGQ